MERVTVQYKGEQITLEVPDGTSDEAIFAHLQSQEQPQQGAQEPPRPKVNLQREDRKSALEMGGVAAAGTAGAGYGLSKLYDAGKYIVSGQRPTAPPASTHIGVGGVKVPKSAGPAVVGSAVLGATTDTLNPVPVEPSQAYSYGRDITQGAFNSIAQARQQSGQPMNTTIGGMGLNALASLGNMVGGVTEGIGRYGNMPSWQSAGQSIADFTQGVMDAVNKEHPVAGRVGQYGAYIAPSKLAMTGVTKLAGPATTVAGNVARAATAEGIVGATTTAGDTETRAIAGAYGAGGGAVGAKIAGKGGLAQPPVAPIPPNPAKVEVTKAVKEIPNAIDSGFSKQLRGADEAFNATRSTAQTAGVTVDDATLIANRAKEIQAHAQSQGISMPQSTAKKQASEELAQHNKKIADEARAVKAKADAEARAAREAEAAKKAQQAEAEAAAKAKADAEAKAAFDASPEGIAAKKAQEAEAAAQAEAEAARRARFEEAQLKQQEMIRNGGTTGNPILDSAIRDTIRRKDAALTPVAPKNLVPAEDILAQIRARGAKGETPSVPANMPEPAPAPAPKQPSPALQQTREALAKQTPEEAPKGMAAFEHMDDILLDSEKIGKSVAQQMAEDPATKAYMNRSAAQRDRHAVTRDARDWIATTQSKGVRTVNKDTLNEWATSQGIVLDWKTAPDIRKLKPNEAKRALSRWAQQQYKNFDPANPPAKELTPTQMLFGE